VRPARWPEDEGQIERIDTSFSTDRIYRVLRDACGFHLQEELVSPPISKTYGSPRLRGGGGAFVAEIAEEIVGFARAEAEAWNRRARITHLYVSGPHRGRGVGTALLRAVTGQARLLDARCLWLETQNVNYPAIQFYRHHGFRLCGLDETLYDPNALPGEVALFFARDLPS
jgi:ribosomal protein S18 acetylase RimI-like enzyme